MADDLKSALVRSKDTIFADALGVIALGVLLVSALALPGLI